MTRSPTATCHLQIALDRIPLERAEAITAAVRAHADWIEVGTSLIKRYGMAGVARIVAAAGGTPVLADMKTADDARTELTMAAEAGATSVTVLGLSTPATLDLAVLVAAERGHRGDGRPDGAGRRRAGPRRRRHAAVRRAGRARAQGRADRGHRRGGAARRLGDRPSARAGRRARRRRRPRGGRGGAMSG